MPLVAFRDLMADAARHRYAVGYFESFSLELLLAVTDAAEAERSPVILGFSGIYLPHPARQVRDRLAPYAAMGLAVCRDLTVPACLLFNECPHAGWVEAAIGLGFNLVMFSDDALDDSGTVAMIARMVELAHARGAAVEAELAALPGVGGDLDPSAELDARPTDPKSARRFVAATGVDALAVNIGQMHLHGRRLVRLDLDRLRALATLPVPLVLHGATSIAPSDLQAAIEIGVRKINVGSRLKQAFLVALREACRCGAGERESVRVHWLRPRQRRAGGWPPGYGGRGRPDDASVRQQRSRRVLETGMKHPVVMPHLGATGGDVKIVEWRIAESDVVAAGAALLTVETDKSVVEVEAFRGGRLTGPLAPPGSSVAPGEVIGYLSDDADAAIPVARMPLAPNAVRAAAASISPPPSPAPVSQEVRAARITVRLSRARDGKGAAGFVERLLDAFATMVLIRRYEEHLYQLFLQGLVPGTLHQCQGQEAVAVGVCSALRRDDLIYSTHRPVGHLIAKGASLEAITAEIWGKATGCVGGKGGQMHLADFAVGAMVSNAIVGANIPIATGSAMSFRLQGLDRVAVSFFGDGASNIGAFHEGLNLAAVQDAPAVFVCENNLYAASTNFALTARITDIAARAAAYGMPGVVVDGMDVEAVYAAARTAVARARAGQGPTLIEAKTYRYRGHSRGDPGGYRERDEHAVWMARDPIERLRRRLIGDFVLDAARLDEIEAKAQARVEAAVEFARQSPEPSPESGLEHVFV